MTETKKTDAQKQGLRRITLGRVPLLLLGFLGLVLGSAVAIAGYRGEHSLSRCMSNPQCAGSLDLLRSLSQLSTFRAELDVGAALIVFSSLLVLYLIIRSA